VTSTRAVIVGYGGQDGRILWDQLSDRGYALVGIGRNSLRTHGTDWDGKTTIDDAGGVQRLIAEFRPEEIYYLAAYHHSSQDIVLNELAVWHSSCKLHVQGFLNLLEAARECHPATRIFYASSSRVFGMPASSPQTEATLLQPICLYGISKLTGMKLGDYYRKIYGIYVSSGILYNHESPLRGRQFISQRVAYGLAKVKAGLCERLEIGNLSARVDWGYAPDYTLAMQLILGHGCPGDFIIASGATHSVREMVETAAKYLGLDCKSLVIENASILQRDPLPLCGDPSHLHETTGWKPRVSFHEMVRILVEAAQAEILSQGFK
jgi:GDPmannose 4,6-dehydratase